MKRILFVDDDANVLQALSRMLHSRRAEWEMEFVSSGKQALETMARAPFDVVVADMRMPGMSGAELLGEVMRLYPGIVRIVLSGQADQEAVFKSVGPAHQYLSKPCDSETLRTTVARACGLRDVLADETLQRLIAKMQTLPSLPAFYEELVQEIQSPDASMHRVGEIIARDVGMTAKVMQLVNSAFFGVRRHVSSPAQAVSLLGLETIRALVLSIHIFSQFDLRRFPGFSLDRLFDHSVRVGAFAREIAKAEGMAAHTVDQSLMAGVLHDAGKLALAANLPDQFAEALRISQEQAVSLSKAEMIVIGANHSEVGAYLLGLWGLPDAIIEAIAYHHSPRQAPEPGLRPLTPVHVANALEHRLCDDSPSASSARVDEAHLDQLRLLDRLPEWEERCAALAAEASRS